MRAALPDSLAGLSERPYVFTKASLLDAGGGRVARYRGDETVEVAAALGRGCGCGEPN